MWEKIRVIFTIPELRKKIFFTLGLLAVYRVGWQIPLPIIDQEEMAAFFSSTSGIGQILSQVAVFSAAQLNQITIFGLGIMPYISAAIIFQLLGTVLPSLQKLKDEGAAGQQKITEWTRYATVGLCIIQAIFWVGFMQGSGQKHVYAEWAGTMSFWLFGVLGLTAGTVFLMWLGEQIDKYGIGNGVSLILTAGIISRMPNAVMWIWSNFDPSQQSEAKTLGVMGLIFLVAAFIFVVAGAILITVAQRRIPIQQAKHTRGRKVYGGQRHYLPLRVNHAGVMPIIFASSLLMLPMMIFGQLSNIQWEPGGLAESFFSWASDAFSRDSFIYILCYVALIYFFCFFWTAITFNPKDVSDNLKNYGSFIPGYRPGKRTSDYLEKVMFRITYVGAGFLALVAIIPTLISNSIGVSPMVASFYGGTGLLIAVSVAFDLVQKIDSHLVMRNYRGLLE